jgi:hypothetical protein
MASGPQVQVHGLRELRRDLKRIDKTLPRELNRRLKKAAEPIRRDAARIAPQRSGKLARSLKVGTRGSRVIVYSRLPYANIVHWGGRHPLFGNKDRWYPQKGTMFVVKAAALHVRDVENAIADSVEGLMLDAGFRR